VNASGVVTGVAPGQTQVIGTIGVRQGQASVTVNSAPVATVSVTLASASITTGATTQATAVLKDEANNVLTGRTITWTSSSTSIATVSSTGLVTAVASGTSTITATSEGKIGTVTITVTRADTEVGGIISTNTTWALANSPYVLTSDVQVAYGSVLTVEPGVIVKGQNRRIAVFGVMNAVGTALSRISFESTRITPGVNQASEPFEIVVEYADLNRGSFYAPTGSAIYGSFVLRNSVIRDASEYMYVWYPVADTYIERNTFINSGGVSIGADLRTTAKHVYVRNNSFERWTAPYGKYFAVVNWASYGGEAVVMKYNSFLSTDRIAVQVETDGQLTATENFWNTVNETVIQSMIFDKSDDLAAPGYVEYRPFLTQPDPNTPSN
jgi:hypothetical protein